MNLLRTNELGVRLDGEEIITSVDFSVDRGEVKGIMGPNGAGKSTFLRLLAGDLLPSTGKIFFGGEDLTRKTGRERSRNGISYLSQRPGCFRSLTVEENLRGAANRGHLFALTGVESRINYFLKLVGLEEKAEVFAGDLSYGEMRVLDLGMALAPRPILLLADEPTAGVSSKVAGEIRGLLSELCRANTGTEKGPESLIFVEHDRGTLFDLADDLSFFNSGELIVEGEPRMIKKHGAVARYLAEHGFEGR